MEGVEISEMERGCLRRQHNDQEAVTKLTGTISNESALNVENRGRSSERGQSRGRSNSRSKSRSLKDRIECWNYDKKGHLKKDCGTPPKKYEQKNSNKDNEASANVASDTVQDALILSFDYKYYESWVIDSATTKIIKDLAIKLNEGEEVVRRWNKNSIYKVPAPMVAINPEAFTPKMVSMGPYHHGKDQLMPMEVHKHRAARCFILKSKKDVEDYVEALWKVLPDLMDSYSQLHESWMQEDNVGRFLELMLIDGCFLLELLHCYNRECEGYEEHDPIFSNHGTISFPHIAFDLMMLENQVPFTAIKTILTVQNDKKPQEEIWKEINNLISMFICREPLQKPDERCGLHMSDIIRNLFAEETADKLSREGKERPATTAKSWSVTELCHAGVKFRAADDNVISLSSIKMEDNVLTIPVIRLSLKSVVIGCNMIAVELMHHAKGTAACSYFTFMNGLMASVADVKRLRSLKIIQSTQLSDDTIFETCIRLAKGNMAIDKISNLYHIQHELDQFYGRRMTGWRGRIWEWITFLKNTYLKNPWTFISVVAATILLSLTVAQTDYAAQSYCDAGRETSRSTQRLLHEKDDGMRECSMGMDC